MPKQFHITMILRTVEGERGQSLSYSNLLTNYFLPVVSCIKCLKFIVCILSQMRDLSDTSLECGMLIDRVSGRPFTKAMFT